MLIVKLVQDLAVVNVHLVMIPNTYKMENVKILVIHTTGKMMLPIPVTCVMITVLNAQVVVPASVLFVMTENILMTVYVETDVVTTMIMKMVPKMNVNHVTLLVPHVNVQQMFVVSHVKETFTILTMKVIRTENVFTPAQKDIMLTQLPTLVTLVIQVVENVLDHPIQSVHIVLQITCKMENVYTHVMMENGLTTKAMNVILVTLHVKHVTMLPLLVVILVPLQDTMMHLPVNVYIHAPLDNMEMTQIRLVKIVFIHAHNVFPLLLVLNVIMMLVMPYIMVNVSLHALMDIMTMLDIVQNVHLAAIVLLVPVEKMKVVVLLVEHLHQINT